MSNHSFDDDIFNGGPAGKPVWKPESKPFTNVPKPQAPSMRELYQKMIQQGERVKILSQDGNMTGTVVGITSLPAPVIGSVPAYIVEVDNAVEEIRPFKDEEGEILYPYTHSSFAAALVHPIDEDTTDIEKVFGVISRKLQTGEGSTEAETEALMDIISRLEKERGA